MSDFVLPYVPSERVGFAPERLERLTAVMQRQIEETKAPGLSMLIARHGKFAYRQCLGALRPGGPAMSEDAIFRIYSMTKPIVSVAAMMLVEEGRLSIIDPVSAYIPAFADVKVGVPNGDRLDLAPLRWPITIQDLLRHTSGLTYGFTGDSPVQKLAKAADVLNLNRTTAENVEAIASLPLMHQPGDAWEYGVSTDVLGRIVEIVEGARLERRPARAAVRAARHDRHGVLHARIEARAARRTVLVRLHDRRRASIPGEFDVAAEIRVGRRRPRVDARRLHPLRRDAEQGGALDGVRILSPQTVAFMASDHLDANVNRNHYLLWPGHGFGLGFAVRTEPGCAPRPGSVGEYFWGGMMGTTFWISPHDSLFAILMVQSPEHREYFRVLFRNLVTAAIA